MKITSGAYFLLLLLQASTVLPRPQDVKIGVIDGVVLDSVTNLPVAGVNVSVRDTAVPEKLLPQGVREPSAIPGVTTDSDGRFSIPNLKLVSYRLTAWADGYADVKLGSNVTTNLGAPISLSSGEEAKHFVIHIARTAIVTGRVLDERGLPAISLPITAFKRIFNRDGNPTEGSWNSVQTDDRGEYRLYGLAPGRYYLRAGDVYGPGSPYAVTYFPNARTIENASELDIKAGSYIPLNWTVNHERTFSVSGRIVDDAGKLPANAGLAMAACSESVSPGLFLSSSSHNPTTGEFVLSNIRTGQYILVGRIVSSTPDPVNNTERLASAEAFVEVKDHDIENVVLRLASPVSLPGKITYEGIEPVPSNTFASIRILMNRDLPPGTTCASVVGTGPLFQRAGSDPTFHMNGLVMNREYRVQVTGVPPDMYIAKILYSGHDVTNDVLHVADASEPMEVVLHSGAGKGKIEGTVKHSDGSAAAGALTVLVPKQRDRRELYKPAIVDGSGHYSIEDISPGEYQLFSFMTNDRFIYFNPRVIKNNEPAGRTVTVTGFSDQAIDLNVIPDEIN
jgi:hypothetical protein